MIGFQAVDEAPLCSTPFSYYLHKTHSLSLSQAVLGGKIYNFALSSNLVVTQDEVAARGVSISSTISLNQSILVNGIYNFTFSSVVNLVSNEDPDLEYNVAVSHPLYLTDNAKASYIYGLEFCDNIALLHKLGWVIDVSMSNHINLSIEDIDTLLNELHFEHLMSTNMEDLNCLSPFGSTGDKDLSSNLIITQSLDAKMVYVCQTAQELEILATLAWR